MLKQIIAVIGCCMLFAAQNKAPERTVQGNTITSEHDPKLRIRLPESVHFVGADRWVLYRIARGWMTLSAEKPMPPSEPIA